MNTCTNCGKGTKNKKFCSRSCSASYNNKVVPRRKPEGSCKVCTKPIKSVNKYCSYCRPEKRMGDLPLSEAKYDKHHKSSGWALVRSRARAIMKKSRKYECTNCGYDRHCEVAHIKSVSEFTEDTMLSVVNDLSNLIYLCPNCHWEFDNGLLELQCT